MSYCHEFRIRRLNGELWSFDSELFAKRAENGAICVWRRSSRYQRHENVLGENVDLVASVPNDHLIFALTSDWTIHGVPVDRGTLPVLERLRAMDLRNRDLAEENIKFRDEQKRKSKRHISNEAEAFWKDNRRAFAKSVDHIRTCNMDKKIDKRRRKGA